MLPAPFWKLLAGQAPTPEDLRSFDVMSDNGLDNILHIDEQGIDREAFGELFDERFVTVLSDGTEAELVPDGASRSVGYDDRAQYVRLCVEARLSEWDSQMAAIREGICEVVPPAFLAVVPWWQLEKRVCSDAVDVEALKASTTYKTLSPSSKTAKHFWEVVTDMTNEERSTLLRFVTGRSRLPAPMELWVSYGSGNDALPFARTCYFALHLPAYSSKAILQEKLLYAIYNCMAMDLDRDGTAAAWDD